MTLTLFWGCVFCAFGAATVLFVRVVATKAQLMIVGISSAFFWLLALTAASILWFVISPLKGEEWFFVPLGVVTQEIFRLVFFRVYERTEQSFAVMSTNAVVFPLTDLSSAIAAGLGFGVMHALMLYGSVLAASTGPGTLFAESCASMSVFVLSACLAFLFIFLHVSLMVVAFDAFRRHDLRRVGYVWGFHLIAACSTIFNARSGGCNAALPVVAASTIGALSLAWFVMHQPGYRSSKRAVRE